MSQAPSPTPKAVPVAFQQLVIPFGNYEGRTVARAPHNFLRWLSMQAGWRERDGIHWPSIAKAELIRRGTRTEGIIPSHHAIDKFSLRYLTLWTDRSVGMAHFLGKLADQAWREGERVEETRNEDEGELMVRIRFQGAIFAFACELSDGAPVALKTVI